MSTWIFEHNKNDTARYLLGEQGARNLICIGLNPSTAVPNNLDATLTRVKKVAHQQGYDGWVMLNLYPQRDTYPKNLHNVEELSLIKENQRTIKNLIGQGGYQDIWASWGNDISRKPYLTNCLKEIAACFDDSFKWYHYHTLTIKGNPRHASRISYFKDFHDFDIQTYLSAHE